MSEATTEAAPTVGSTIGGETGTSGSSKLRKAKPRATAEPVVESSDTEGDNSDRGSVETKKTTLEEALGYLHYIDSTIDGASGHTWAMQSQIVKSNVARCCAYVRAHLTTGIAPEFE